MIGRSQVRSAATTAAALALLAAGVPYAAAAPATDERGFVDSWASCASPSTAVAFGSTATSRVAVCKSTDGQYQYRGVRVRDGAKLAVDAKPSGNNGFVADGDGVSYTVTPSALLVSAQEKVIRDEPWVTYSGPEAPASAPAAPTSTTPLPPPLPAEEGHGG
jgi:hypothetical protein